jgi:spore maturation protein CgeB
VWPRNIERVEHLAPRHHRRFYNRQRFTLNITRADMVAAGWSPSVRIFEAAACGTPIISDVWPGLEEFFVPDREILLARSTAAMLALLRETSTQAARELGAAARAKVLALHTAAHRAEELEQHLREAGASAGQRAASSARARPTAKTKRVRSSALQPQIA